ncbi:hypothetical protein GQ55_5G104500 [Panicum hallii var. hallii]|uniref:Uncharacterized protein n=1 Tax=Panicum hallii var. hallii TaxID=1504633 RepID=A0A2T7DEV9_9POAL|nr:hypothetical protein GQ55_5G104500 [Panicum hallii var. hallii]
MRWGYLILLLFNFSTGEKGEESAWSPCPLSAWRRGALFQWACRKSQLTWRGRPDAAPPGSAPPSRTFPFFPAARAGGRDARGWSGAERDAGGKARRGHRSGSPRAQTHRSSSADPPPPTALPPLLPPLFRPFHCARPRKLLTSGLTAPALTPLTARPRPLPKLESERGLGTGIPHRAGAARRRPPGHVRHFSVICLPGPG